MSFGVVVLNFMDYRSTLACVHSLLQCAPPPKRIVVVDNQSSNDSMSQLEAQLNGIDNLEIVNSGFNGGYSFGNNYGIRLLKESGVDHVVIATSDTKVISKDIFAKFAAAIGPGVGVLGPIIEAPCGEQNPAVEILSIKYIIDSIWVQHGMPGRRLRAKFRTLWHCLKSRVCSSKPGARPNSGIRRHSTQEVYMLHGSFLCLTDEYLKKAGLLDQRIFMFGEEDLIAWNCEINGLKRKLVFDAKVFHSEDTSIAAAWGNRAGSFVEEQLLASGKVLRQATCARHLLFRWLQGRSGINGVL